MTLPESHAQFFERIAGALWVRDSLEDCELAAVALGSRLAVPGVTHHLLGAPQLDNIARRLQQVPQLAALAAIQLGSAQLFSALRDNGYPMPYQPPVAVAAVIHALEKVGSAFNPLIRDTMHITVSEMDALGPVVTDVADSLLLFGGWRSMTSRELDEAEQIEGWRTGLGTIRRTQTRAAIVQVFTGAAGRLVDTPEDLEEVEIEVARLARETDLVDRIEQMARRQNVVNGVDPAAGIVRLRSVD